MGQTSSRYHEPSTSPVDPTPSTATDPVAGASTDPQPGPSVDLEAPTPDVPRSRRSSVRKNILKFVKPGNILSRLGTGASNLGEVGRSGRNSRRWSKTPLDPPIQPLEPQLASSSNSLTEGPSNSPPSPLDKGKQREIFTPLEEEDSTAANVVNVDQSPQVASATPIPEPNPVTSTLDNSHFAMGAFPDPRSGDEPSQDVQPTEDLEIDSSIPDPSPVYEWDSNDATDPPEPQPSPQQSTALPPRAFPPPGTLVVVQGIVHTTDVSRGSNPPSSSHSPPGDSNPSLSNSRPTSGLDPASEQGSSRARNRLSALLRPRSTSSRPPSALVNDSTPAVIVTGPPEAESSPVSTSESQSSSDESAQTGITAPTLNEPVDSHQDEPSPPTEDSLPVPEHRVPSISSSSIDVLGTLLSVAAAATAASLLTGSSEPILSSGLAPPGSNPSPASSAHPISTLSAPTTSLPNLPTYPRPPTPNADISAAGRAERMRQAWGTIRERLGLRPSVPHPGARNVFPEDINGNSPSPTPLGGDAAASGAPTDTRELMLAEMARAFNIGLGLNGLGGVPPSANAANGQADREAVGVPNNSSNEDSVPAEGSENDSSHSRPGPGTSHASVTMPPEGSFERFLVDLQIDLRAALTRAEDEVDPTQEQQREPQDLQPPALSANATGPTDSTLAPSPTASIPPPRHGTHLVGNAGSPESADDDFYDDMPHLQELSDSESEFDEDNHEDDDDDDDDFRSVGHESANAEGQNELPNSQSQPPTSGSGRIDASGRINWWRLYRFPPIASPRMDMAGLRQPLVSTPQTTSSPLTETPTPSNPNDPPISVDTASTSTATTDASPADTHVPSSIPLPESPTTISPAQTSTQPGSTPPSQVPLNAVVPVIVVGLQSVNQEWRPEMPAQGENDGMDLFGQSTSEEVNATGSANENGDEDDLDGLGGQHTGSGTDGTRGRGRARGWHSRAANAIRNLRPGRRNAEAGSGAQMPLIAPGSRTFLIYVIGGYYPPDHSIVTGGPNILDSFEALLELADLLGQVKPPTVSKDDIEKSGLKIIKASEMEQHEKEGQVASNCLDRCLICLDDYEPEDPIRVMTCRHAFHKGCVDEWLQKGRNNCPACRSTGVTTDPHPSPATPMPAS